MPKVKQKEVKEKLEEWVKLQEQISTYERNRNKKLLPFQVKYNEDTKPILEQCERKANPLREKAADIQKEISVLLFADRDAEGNPKPITVLSENATASVERKEGSRTIDAQKFFNFVKDKTPKFWECVTILIGKAKDVISENEIDDLSTKKTTFDVSISLKK